MNYPTKWQILHDKNIGQVWGQNVGKWSLLHTEEKMKRLVIRGLAMEFNDPPLSFQNDLPPITWTMKCIY